MTSSAGAGSRYCAPSRWCRWEGEGEVVTVAELLGQNQRLLFQYRPPGISGLKTTELADDPAERSSEGTRRTVRSPEKNDIGPRCP
jgi:hypothetical protein